MKLVVGIDIGGTKSHLVATDLTGHVVAENVIPTENWSPGDIPGAVDWILDRAKLVADPADTAAIGVGGMGFNSVEHSAEVSRALIAAGGRPAVAVNDAALLLPAAGLRTGVAVIAGTGAIAVATDATGEVTYSGGWGWVIGDEGGASALVREAAKRALAHWDRTHEVEALGEGLFSEFGVASMPALARAVNDVPTPENWAPHCASVFDAADAGSQLATEVIGEAARGLALQVSNLAHRGADIANVVAAGSVIVNQPRLADDFVGAVREFAPDAEVHILRVPPVHGAMALALDLLSAEARHG